MSVLKLILGTVQLGLSYGVNNKLGKPSESLAIEILKRAYKLGIRKLDTADGYGSAHEIIRCYHENNPSFLILTKFKLQPDETSIDKTYQKTTLSLGVNHLTAYSFHSFNDLKTSKALQGLEILKKQNKISAVGVSIYDNEELKEVLSLREIDIIQLPFNLLDNATRRGALIQLAKKNNKIIHVRSVYLQGLFFMETLPPHLKPLQSSLNELKLISKKFGISLPEMAMRYPLSFNEIDGVLVGVESLEQLEESVSCFNNGPLPKEILSAIGQVVVSNEALLCPVNWK